MSKEEGKKGIKEIETQYGLDKYPKGEFYNAILKEFVKYGRKLQKIAVHEASMKQGKKLDKDEAEMVQKKEQFIIRLDALKGALDAHAKCSGQPVATQAPHEEESKSGHHLADHVKDLAGFLAIGAALAHKDRLMCDPFNASASLKDTEIKAIVKLYRQITCSNEDKDMSLHSEVESAKSALQAYFKKGNQEVVSEHVKIADIHSAVEKLLNEPGVMGTSYKIEKRKPEGVFVAPVQPKEEPVKAPAAPLVPAAIPPVTTQPPKPEPKEITQLMSSAVPAPVQAPVPAAPVKSDWVNNDDQADEEYDAPINEKAGKVPGTLAAAEDYEIPTKEDEWHIAGEEDTEGQNRGYFGRGGRRRGGYPRGTNPYGRYGRYRRGGEEQPSGERGVGRRRGGRRYRRGEKLDTPPVEAGAPQGGL